MVYTKCNKRFPFCQEKKNKNSLDLGSDTIFLELGQQTILMRSFF